MAPANAKKPAPNQAKAKAKPAAAKQTKRAAPKQPKRAAPKKAAPKKAAPKKADPKKADPKKADPKKAAPRQAPARRASINKPIPTQGTTAPAGGGARVVEILEDEQPIDALRRFLATIDGVATVMQGQVALGSAQLMLLPIAREHRGGDEVKELLDLVLSRWTDFPDPAGFHAQEFLRNAFAAVGDDPERIAKLVQLVPEDASAELRFNIACAYAVIGTKAAMLQALAAALDAGATASQVRRDADFDAYHGDPELERVLEGAAAPIIPVDVRPHVVPVRSALESLVATLKEYGEQSQLSPPASLDNILATERARRIQLPNDYRALLTLADGMKIWDNEFFGTRDYRSETELARRARAYIEESAGYGATGIDECIPLANWGQPNDWLLYDPRGTIRRGEPGYVLMLNADELPLDDLVAALQRLESIASDILGTN
ncbi:MAG: SMI1/KNR4 family protein [Myxococcales bacterium]|nr:SMI1/KNR4 family protein [Myxococcales bacterium]